MVSSAIRFLAIVGLLCAVNAVDNINTWGDLSTQVVLGSTKSKIGIPFVQRSLELSYPEANFNPTIEPNEEKNQNLFFVFCRISTLRDLKHTRI